jgi:hypothetical protein
LTTHPLLFLGPRTAAATASSIEHLAGRRLQAGTATAAAALPAAQLRTCNTNLAGSRKKLTTCTANLATANSKVRMGSGL